MLMGPSSHEGINFCAILSDRLFMPEDLRKDASALQDTVRDLHGLGKARKGQWIAHFNSTSEQIEGAFRLLSRLFAPASLVTGGYSGVWC